MPAPAVAYITASDGARLAYSVAGTGRPLLFLPNENLSMTGRWEVPQSAAFYEALGENRQLITLDLRGIGLSDRGRMSASSAEVADDLAALAEHLGLASFDVFACRHSSFVAIRLAATHPGLIRRMVLWEPIATGSRLMAQPQMDMARRMVAGDWELYWENILKILNMPSEYAALWADSISQSDYAQMMETGLDEDSTDALPLVSAETLVIRHAASSFVPMDEVRTVAAGIDGARFVQLSGSPYCPWLEEAAQPVLAATLQLLDSEAAPSGHPDSVTGGFQTILFTDLESSTALTQRVGDEAAQEVLRGHNTAVRGALEANGGREVKHTGDGIMASFPSAVSAVQAGLAIQRELAGGEVRVRVGLNAGEPIAEDDDLFGTAVQLAARVVDRAEPGQVLVSRVVMDLCAGKGFEFSSVGEATLKGFDEPVTLYEVRAG
jgi:class 3 adenylate cyclase/pimeloyl-ACP methyl ester carboxylesterase